MLTDTNVAWLIYIAAAFFALLLFWFMTRNMQWLWWRDMMRITVAVIVAVPIPVDSPGSDYAPAFMALAFAGLTQDADQALRASLPLIVCFLIFFVCLSFYHLVRRRQ